MDHRRVGDESEAHPDGRAGVVVILDFGFGQRGAVFDAPVDRLEALIDIAAVQELDERAGDHGLVVRAHREIGIFPLAEHAQALEILALQVDEFLGVLAAGAADFDGRHLRFLGAEVVIDLDLDGQAVAVPARDVGRIEARHGLRFDDEVLQDLIESRAEVDPAVGIGRARRGARKWDGRRGRPESGDTASPSPTVRRASAPPAAGWPS